MWRVRAGRKGGSYEGQAVLYIGNQSFGVDWVGEGQPAWYARQLRKGMKRLEKEIRQDKRNKVAVTLGVHLPK